MKVKKPPSTALYPCPIILVTCGEIPPANIITLAWTGTTCSDPPMIGFSIRPSRHSFQLIEEGKGIVVNIPTEDIVEKTDLCGIVSGKTVNKFSETGFTPDPAEHVAPPLIRECPVNLECRVTHKLPLGSHYLFLAEILAVHVRQDIVDPTGKIDFAKAAPIVYNRGEYWNLNHKIGVHGFSRD